MPATNENRTVGSLPLVADHRRVGLFSALLMSAWCGLIAGLFEVATIVGRKHFYDTNQLYGMSRHFIWLIPATNLCLFTVFGLLGCIVLLTRSPRGEWLFWRVLCALTILPMALVAVPAIYGLAWLLVALGAAALLVPVVERHPHLFRRFIQVTFPLALVAVALSWASLRKADRDTLALAAAAPLPPAGSPNVLLIVMDTVAAGHTNLHGHDRATTTTLIELADRGIRFDCAQAAAPWTLPSHAAMFTGRWMHELGVGWLTPLTGEQPTLAGFLSSRGYDTAGFVANTAYCARDSGLDRGFTRYSDFIFPHLTAFKKTVLVNRALAGIQSTISFLEDQFEFTRSRFIAQKLGVWFDVDRKTAAIINRELLDWLAERGNPPRRPFFAFLNYFDAHYPYELPVGNYHRFGGKPADMRQRAMIDHWGELDKTPLTPQELAFGATAYDDCIADLDEQIGILLDALERKGILENTWLIVVADHGESFGEHPGIFCHGTSLYQTELHVPLLVVPPGEKATKRVVNKAVSLRDIAATIIDFTGQNAGSPFPGQSLSRFWKATTPGTPVQGATSAPALAEVVPNPNAPGNHDPSGVAKPTTPLGALKDAEWSYIRRESDRHEELFRLIDDAKEEHNLAADPAAQPTLERMRAALGSATKGPLLPSRFGR